MAMNAGNRHDIANAKTVEVIQLHRRFADFITLVDCQNHRLAAAHQHTGNILVLGGNASANFAHHDNTIRGINGNLGLFPHMGQQAVVNVGLNAAGINQQELMAAPFAITENTVAGNAGRIFHNGKALAGQLVKKR